MTETEAEVYAILQSLRIGRIKLARLVEECEVEFVRPLRFALIDLDRTIERLEGRA